MAIQVGRGGRLVAIALVMGATPVTLVAQSQSFADRTGGETAPAVYTALMGLTAGSITTVRSQQLTTRSCWQGKRKLVRIIASFSKPLRNAKTSICSRGKYGSM